MCITAIYFHPVKGTPEQWSPNWGACIPGGAQSIGVWKENIFVSLINKIKNLRVFISYLPHPFLISKGFVCFIMCII